MPVTPGSELNKFGFAALAGLVGLFAKQATSKLDQVLNTLFNAPAEADLRDKLDAAGQPAPAPRTAASPPQRAAQTEVQRAG
jgi:hypothetical protein